MANGLLSMFDPYDLIAKSFPGMAFVIGLSAFIPTHLFDAIINADQRLGTSVIVFIIIISAIVVVGVLIGEAIHTLAIIIEKFADWLGRRVTNTRKFIYSNSKLVERLADGRPADYLENRYMEEPYKLLVYGWVISIITRSVTAYHNIKYLLVGHRRVFQLRLEQRLNYGQGSLYENLNFYEEHFINRCREQYGTEPEELAVTYPVIIDLLKKADNERALKFQARYALCRGMWVVLFALSVMYIVVGINPDQITGVLIAELSIPELVFLLLGMGIFSAVFMYGTIRYKLLFVDYIYSTIYGLDNPDDVPWENVDQNRLGDYT